MAMPTDATTRTAAPANAGPLVLSAEGWMSELSGLLRELESVSAAHRTLPPVVSAAVDNQLVQVRLGVAASLFAALQCRHAASAGHSLRVALSCSALALKLDWDPAERDAVETAALLHDVGVIGVPDHILLKPGALSPDEAAIMARARQMSLDVLRPSCSSPEVLAIVENVGAWYDGRRTEFAVRGKEIPAGARMIAVVEAFDAMTTDHVYRPAMSQERAMTELFACAGTQFDPELVRSFAEFHAGDQTAYQRAAAERWLKTLDPQMVNSSWELNCVPSPSEDQRIDALFEAKLLENMYDAVVFIDAAGRVTLWNRGAERLTGIPAASIRQRHWHPDLLNTADEKGHPIAEGDCPVNCAIRSGVQSLRRLTISGRAGRPTAVDTHAIPVMGEDGATRGAILLFHDASSETTLEQRCQNLHDKATKDPMTQVANRAEFDRVHEMFIAAHQQQQVPCSLIICDLDKFKSVNDVYGHQAGDDVIKSLANLLKSACRPGDLVARYGGEEFVVLCADCDNASAARRAEQMRRALTTIPQPRMGGRTISASFGVTEIQPGDTPDTMLRRADRALLQAKANGRNQVVQLGSGSNAENNESGETKRSFWPFQSARPKELLEQTLFTPVPIKMAIEKLRGFIADHGASVLHVDGNQVRLEIEEKRAGGFRRLTDRPVAFRMDITFEEQRGQQGDDADAPGGPTRTKIRVLVSPRKNRDRRRDDLFNRAREVLASFRAYLMASDEDPETEQGAMSRAKRFLAPWLGKK
jgi:diguanylate cyclase (GGDEF)-like protein